MHAEALAIGGAVLDGHGTFDAIAVSSADRDGTTPCGLCRQTLLEFCDESLRIVCDEGEDTATYTLGSLLPHAFHASGLLDE